MNNFVDKLEWQGNSLAMYKGILNAVPSFFRKSVNSSIQAWITRNNLTIITEDLVFKAVDEIAPKNLANSRIKPELMKLKTRN